MESLEDDLALNIDSLMEDDDFIDSENEYNLEPIPLYFVSNTPIEFGFFEQSSNSFYSISVRKNTDGYIISAGLCKWLAKQLEPMAFGEIASVVPDARKMCSLD